MELISPDTNVDFVGKMGKAFYISILLIVITLISLVYHKGPNWGVEFIGGTEIHLEFQSNIGASEIRGDLEKIGYPTQAVQQLGLSGDEYLVRFAPEVVSFEEIQGFQNELESLIASDPDFKGASILRIDYIGPRVGSELIQKAILSILIGCIGILIYINIRFEIGFAMGAVIALIHDTVITLGAISITDKEFTLAIVAALLTVIGYSVNDTIIIFDRIRENMNRTTQMGFLETVNEGVNQTLSRTILTSVTVFIVLIPLFFLGGSVIHDFAFTLIVGVIVGTYSSIFVASAFVLYWRRRQGALA